MGVVRDAAVISMYKAGQKGSSNLKRWFYLLKVKYQVLWMQPILLCIKLKLRFLTAVLKGIRATASTRTQRWWEKRVFFWWKALWSGMIMWGVWVEAGVKTHQYKWQNQQCNSSQSWLLMFFPHHRTIFCLSCGADMASSVSKIIKKSEKRKKQVWRCLSKHSLNIKYATRSLNIKYNTIAPHNVLTSD